MCSSPIEPGHARAARGEAEPRGRAARALGCAALALGATSCINGPLRTFRSTGESAHTAADSSKSLSNIAELSEHDSLGPGLEYRLDAQLVQSLSDRSSGGVDSHDTTLSARPSGELVLSWDTVRWSQRIETLRSRSTFSLGQDTQLARNDFLEKLEWMPPGLPQFTTWLNVRTVNDEQFVDQSTLESVFQVQQALPVIDYQYTLLSRVDQDDRTGVENDRLEHTLRASWREELQNNRFNSTVSVFANRRRNDLSGRFSGAPGVEVLATQGVSDIDATPQISTLSPNAALVDTTDTVGTGVNVGGFASGGEQNWNFGARLTPGSTIDTIHVSTVDPVDAVYASQFVFTIWISDDNTFWTQVGNIAAPDYDNVLRRFRLSIPAVTTTWIKVVNSSSPPAAPAVLVSELRFFRSATSGSPSIRTNDETESGTVGLSYRLTDRLTVGYDLFLQQANTDTSDVDVRDEERIDQGVWANFTPHSKVDTNVRFANQRTRDPVVRDEDVNTITGLVAYHPLDTLDLNASYSNIDREVNGSASQKTEAIQGLTSAQLFDTLRTDVTLQRSTLDDAENSRTIDHWVTGVTVVADLTTALELSLGWRDDRADVSGAGAADIPDPSEQRTEMLWVLKPSDQFVAQTEFDWVDSFAGKGLDKRIRFDWIPFPNGSLDVTLDYDHVSVGSAGSSEYDRYRGQLRHTITPRAFLLLDYSLQDPGESPRTEIISIAFNFSS